MVGIDPSNVLFDKGGAGRLAAETEIVNGFDAAFSQNETIEFSLYKNIYHYYDT